jgi:predicted dehydrogenase
MIRVAMLSYWHVHAWDYTRQAQSHPDVTIGAVWDELPERGRAAAEQLGVPFYESLDDLLALPEIDAVIVDAPTSMHRDVMVRRRAPASISLPKRCSRRPLPKPMKSLQPPTRRMLC